VAAIDQGLSCAHLFRTRWAHFVQQQLETPQRGWLLDDTLFDLFQERAEANGNSKAVVEAQREVIEVLRLPCRLRLDDLLLALLDERAQATKGERRDGCSPNRR